MKLKPTAICAAVALALTPHAARATTYYVVDCQSGADPACAANVGSNSNGGTSPASPKQFLTSAFIAGLSAGDQVLKAKGGSWTYSTTLDISNASATGTSPITYGTYTPSWGAGTAKPKIVYSGTGNPFARTYTANRAGWVFDGWDITVTDSSTNAFEWWGKVSDVTLQNMTITGSMLYMAAPLPQAEGGTGPSRRVHIIGNTIQNALHQGILVAASDLRIAKNYFKNNATSTGAPAILDHHLYLDSVPRAANTDNDWVENILVEDNDFEDDATNACDSAMIVAHNHMKKVTVKNNRLRQSAGTAGGSCYAIAFTQGNDDTGVEGFEGLQILANKIDNVGFVFIEVNNAADVLIANNVLTQTTARDFRAIEIGEFRSSTNDIANNRIAIVSNTIRGHSINDTSQGIWWNTNGGAGTGHTIACNLISFSSSVGGVEFVHNVPANSAFTTWDYNLFYQAGGTTIAWTTSNSTLSAWRSASGFDTHSLNTDPLFRGAPTDLQIGSSSPARDAGSTVCHRLAYQDYVRDATRDIGAFEYGVNP